VNFEKFVQAVKRLRDYWFTVVVLPTGKAQGDIAGSGD
jgi:hypothetical protein